MVNAQVPSAAWVWNDYCYCFPSLSWPSEPTAPPGMSFLHFGREMAEGNQELGLHASPTDRHVHPGTGKGRRARERKPLSEEKAPQVGPWSWGWRCDYAGTWLSKASGCWDPTTKQLFVRSEVIASLEEVPGQLTSLCKSGGPGQQYGQGPFKPELSTLLPLFHTTSPVSSLLSPFPRFSAFPGSGPGDMKLLITCLHNQGGLFLVFCNGS